MKTAVGIIFALVYFNVVICDENGIYGRFVGVIGTKSNTREPCYGICSWLPWSEWNDCSQSCGGGRQGRSRLLCCRLEWHIEECKSECGVTSSDFRDYQSCNIICYNGDYLGSRCSCYNGYYDSCCSSRIYCGTPPSIGHGEYTGSNFYHGGIVHYNCHADHNMTSGTKIRECIQQTSSSGVWSGSTPRCQYVKTCLSNPCQNGATCVDGVERYNCVCGYGWSGTNCEFDILPPEVSNCSDNITKIGPKTALEISWPVPSFSDPMDTNLIITSNYQQNYSTFAWGEYGVQYVADKPSNGKRTVCLFYVNYYPIPCPKLKPPGNGSVASNGWNSRFTEVSTMFCRDGYSFDVFSRLDTVYICGATGLWLPPVPQNLNCLEYAYHSDTNALHNYKHQNEIPSKYLIVLQSSDLEEMCTSPQWDGQCIESNVNVREGL